MSTPSVNQQDSSVGGHQAARDVNDSRTYNLLIPRPQITRIRALLDKFREENGVAEQCASTIESLQHYLDVLDPTRVLGVEAKLEGADRSTEVVKALKLKEHFFKLLSRLTFSRSAQEVFACLLGDIEFRFDTHVRPLIQAKSSPAEVDAAVLQHVIQPVLNEVAENDMGINIHELRGMLYFLTGNCHIDWS
jgi:hypothetical protein